VSETVKRSFKDFFILWIGQVVSVFGSGLTNFAIGVWVFQRTGSATEFALIAVSGSLPAMFVAPFAGVLVDRLDRRTVMALADIGAAMASIALISLLLTGNLEVWHIYLIVAVSSSFNSLQVPAYMSSVTMMIPKEHFGRANGMLEFGESLARVFAPLLAGILISAIKIQGVVAVDFATFLFAMVTLLMIRIPRPEITAAGRAAQGGGLFRQAGYGWKYIVARPGLLGLLMFFTLINLLLAVGLVLTTPLVLSFAPASQLGLVLALGSAGSLVGGLFMSTWKGAKQKMNVILGFAPVLGLGLIIMGLRPWTPLVAAGYFLFFLVVPVLNASHMAIWQTKVEPDIQGRVFAMRRLVFQASFPIAFLSAGPLADKVFRPLLAEGGPLAGSVGTVLGVGPGRGIGLLFITMGGLLIVAALAGYLFPRMRRIETEIPDALPDRAPAGA
jgi:DHA3 family macrolide efflux protein-like MFS transporter